MNAVFLNDEPYRNGETNPLEALKDTLAFSVDDWADSRAKAWVYGIVLGWDGADAELAERFGWTPDQLLHLDRLHQHFEAMAADHTEGET